MTTTRDRSILVKLLALLAALSLVAAACGDDDNGVADPTDPNGAAAEGGEIVVAATQELSSFNNNTAADNLLWGRLVVQHIYPQTFRVNPDLELEWLLTDPPEVVSEDPFTVEWRIHEDAEWSDGTPVSADDFEYYWQACNGRVDEGQPVEVDEETGEETVAVDCVSTSGYSLIEEVEKSEDGKTFTAFFSDVDGEFERLFGEPMPPAHIAHENGDPWEMWNEGFRDEPFVSAGPYELESWARGDNLVLTRNENYWGEPANLDRIIFTFVDEDAAVDALRNREVDVIAPQPQIDLLQQVEGFEGVSHEVVAGLTFEHITLNLRNELLGMLEVRQALAHALDREEIVDALVRPFDPDAEVAGNRIWMPNQPQYVDTTPDRYRQRDIEAARELLEDAGFTEGADGVYELDGERLSLRISTTGGNPRRERAQELMIDQLREAGIELTTYNLPGADVFTRIFADLDFDLALFAYVGTPFRSGFTPQAFGTGSGGNPGAYSNDEVDALAAEAIGTVDADERADLLNEIDALLWEDLPMIPLYQLPDFVGWNDDYLNIGVNPSTAGFTWNAHEWARRA